jgi:hypothetical protein
MKWLFTLLLITFTTSVFADAGFSIRRKKAAVNISFSGTDKLTGYKLIHATGYYIDTADKRPFANKGTIVTENYSFVVQNGGKRWEESDRNQKFILVDENTGVATDSFTLYAKTHNIHYDITGVKDGKIQYNTKKSMAVYQYTVVGEESDNTSTHKINLVIYIVISLLGFVLLVYLFKRQKKNIAI